MAGGVFNASLMSPVLFMDSLNYEAIWPENIPLFCFFLSSQYLFFVFTCF